MEQSLNFEMLRSQWPELAELACMAERYVHSDPESCLVKLRNYTELMVRWLYRQERLPEGIKANLYDLMNADVFTSMMPEAIIMKMDALRIHGNRAAHGGRIKAKDTYWLLKEAYLLGIWLYVRYAHGNVDDCPKFTLPPLTQSSGRADEKRLEDAIRAQDESRERELALQRALQQEQEKAEHLTQRLNEARARNQHVADILSIDEAETRRRLIDSRLLAADWNVGEGLKIPIRLRRNIPLKNNLPRPETVMRTMSCGMRHTNRWRWWKQKKPASMPSKDEFRPGCMQTGWKKNTTSVRSSSTPTAMISGCGMTIKLMVIPRVGCLASTARKACNILFNSVKPVFR